MALQLQITNTEVGASFDAAYAKIIAFHGENVPDQIVEIVVDFYASSAAREANARPVQRLPYHTTLPSGDLMAGLYAYLKSLPEFASAVDC